MKYLPALILLLFTFSIQAQTYKVGVAFNSNIMPVNDRFEFRLNTGEKIVIDTGHRSAWFERSFKAGDPYSISQTSGPRTCNIQNNEHHGTISNTDILVSAGCGSVPLTMGKMRLLSDVTGESFSFKDNYGRSRTIPTPWNNEINLGAFPAGDPFVLQQTGGPRTCIITPALNTFPEASFTIQADCRKNTGTGTPVDPSGPVTPVKLSGTFTAPAGTKITLRLVINGATKNLPVTASGAAGSGVTTTPFIFPDSYLPGTPYKVQLATAPPNVNCSITENAESTIPANDQKVRVICDNTYDLVTRDNSNKIFSTYYESWAPVIAGKGGDEGRYVAFSMYGKSIDGSSGNYRQIYYRDRKTGITRMVSKFEGKEGNQNSFAPAISADGQTVAFETYATNLGAGDNNGVRDVYMWNAKTGKLTLVSKTAGGTAANGESYEPSVSGDGNVVTYTTNASNIVNFEQVYSTPNVMVFDQRSGNTFHITKDYETGKAGSGYSPVISEDGNRIAFCSFSYKLVQNDKNNLWDIFLWERGAAGLKRISVPNGGGERDQGTESSSRVIWPAISGDGNNIVFATTATNLVADDKNGFQDYYLYHIPTNSIKRVSRLSNTQEPDGDNPVGQGERPGISYDGTWIAYNTAATNMGVPKGNIIMQNTKTGEIVPLTNIIYGSSARPMLSRTGSYVVAGCSEPYDKRFNTSGIFTFFTGKGVCNNCEPQNNTPQ